MIKATWCISNNVGDALTVWLIKKIAGETPIYVEPRLVTPKHIVCGSIANWATANTTVWGAGIANKNDVLSDQAEYLAVRGYHTKKRLTDCTLIDCPVVGDPALLLPLFYTPQVEKTVTIGLVPHYVNQYECASDGMFTINVFEPVEQFIDNICKCQSIISSSLHGCIVAAAYGIPFLWVEYAEPLGGDRTKFYDFLSSLGFSYPKPGDSFVPDMDKIKQIQDNLMEVCPFK